MSERIPARVAMALLDEAIKLFPRKAQEKWEYAVRTGEKGRIPATLAVMGGADPIDVLSIYDETWNNPPEDKK